MMGDDAKRFIAKNAALIADRRVSIIIDTFHGVNWWEKTKVFPCFTIYFNASDMPDKYVVRLFDGNKPTRLMTVRDTLDEARKTIPNLFRNVGRKEADTACIVETWL